MSNALIKSKSFKDVVQSDAVKARLKEILGERAAQFSAALTQLVNQSNQLQKCDPNSVLGAAITAASLDLSIDPNIGEAHVVPYGEKAQFQIGYRGFIQLAMRSGQYKALGSCVVYEGELESYDELTGELIVRKNKGQEKGEVIGYAAKFKLINGFERGEFWTADEIEAHASRYSKAYRYAKGNPQKEAGCLWVTDRDSMALKTVEKSLLAHYGPKSIQMQKAIKMDGGAVIDADSGHVEYVDNEQSNQQIVKPVFDEPQVEAVDVQVVAPEPKPSAPAQKKTTVVTAKTVEKTAEEPANNKRKAIKLFISQAKQTEEKFMSALDKYGGINDNDAKTIDELSEQAVEIIYGDLAAVVHDIKNS